MGDKKTKVDCCLTTRGTKQADAKVVDDLTVSDPKPAVGERIIQLQSELELLELRLHNKDYNETTGENGIPMSEAKEIALEMRAKRAEIAELHTRSY